MRSYFLVLPLVAIFTNVAAGDLPPYCAANQLFEKGPEPARLYKVICDIPLEALISNPDRYSGYFVQTDGFYKSEYHGDYLYPNCTAAQAGRLRAKITVSIASDNEDEPLEGFVHNVVGLFDAKSLTIRNARVHLLPPYDSSFDGCTFDQEHVTSVSSTRSKLRRTVKPLRVLSAAVTGVRRKNRICANLISASNPKPVD